VSIADITNGEAGSSVRTKLNQLIGLENRQVSMVNVSSKADLPPASGGVITLADDTVYTFLGDIDLTGDRIVCGTGNMIRGTSSETSFLSSTGLSTNPLIYANSTLPLRDITLKDADVGIDINSDDTGTNIALDWAGVNFSGCTTSAVFGNINNFIFSVGAVLAGGSFRFEGDVDTIGIQSSIFVGDGGAGENLIELTSTANVTRRFRVIYSAFVAFGSTTAVSVDPAATISNEGYILDTCNFSGGGTYLSGVQSSDNKALFSNNVGIDNSADISQYYMNGNATATVITQGVPVKAAGTTSSSSITSKFTNTDNRATYEGALTRFFKVTATLSVTSGNNNQIGVYIAKNGGVIAESEVYGTTSGSGRAENIVVQTLVELTATDYIEIWVENDSSSQNITVTDMNVIIE
jgi:hypothetical protein